MERGVWMVSKYPHSTQQPVYSPLLSILSATHPIPIPIPTNHSSPRRPHLHHPGRTRSTPGTYRIGVHRPRGDLWRYHLALGRARVRVRVGVGVGVGVGAHTEHSTQTQHRHETTRTQTQNRLLTHTTRSWTFFAPADISLYNPHLVRGRYTTCARFTHIMHHTHPHANITHRPTGGLPQTDLERKRVPASWRQKPRG